MQIEGKIYKDGKQWLVEVPILDVMTQGKTRKQALNMIIDAISLLVEQKRFVKLVQTSSDAFLLSCDDTKKLLAIILKRQRLKNDLTLEEMAEQLKVKSKNTYAQYEQGRSEPSLSQMQKILRAIDRKLSLVIDVSST